MWSIGNEVGEQFTGANGAALAKQLSDIVHEEDPTRPTTTADELARAPTSPFPGDCGYHRLELPGRRACAARRASIRLSTRNSRTN